MERTAEIIHPLLILGTESSPTEAEKIVNKNARVKFFMETQWMPVNFHSGLSFDIVFGTFNSSGYSVSSDIRSSLSNFAS